MSFTVFRSKPTLHSSSRGLYSLSRERESFIYFRTEEEGWDFGISLFGETVRFSVFRDFRGRVSRGR